MSTLRGLAVHQPAVDEGLLGDSPASHASDLQHSAVETGQPPPDLQHPAVETKGANPAPDLQHLAVETELVSQPIAGPAEATRYDPNANGLAGDVVSPHG